MYRNDATTPIDARETALTLRTAVANESLRTVGANGVSAKTTPPIVEYTEMRTAAFSCSESVNRTRQTTAMHVSGSSSRNCSYHLRERPPRNA